MALKSHSPKPLIKRITLILVLSCECKPLSALHNETLTKNITHLLDNLLTNYDKKIRPMNKDDPTEPLLVTVDISIRSMGPISEKDMEFSLDCYFRQYWMDERLKFYGSMERLALAPKVLNDIWKPDTYIKNGRQSYLHKLTIPNILLRVEQNGRVYVSQRLTIRARCPMYMRKFPMDSQACILRLGSLGYSRKDIQFRWSSVTLEPELGAELAQYTLLKYITVENNESDPRGPSFGIMTVLNMATLGMGLRSDLPKVSYSTALDVYVVACFGFVFLALVEYAVINFAAIVQLKKAEPPSAITPSEPEFIKQLVVRAKTANTWNIIWLINFVTEAITSLRSAVKSFVSMNLVHRMHVFAGAMMGANPETMTRTEIDQITNENLADEATHRLVCVAIYVFMSKYILFGHIYYLFWAAAVDPTAVDKIDAVSKVLFPAMYAAFNALYWTLYLYYIADEIDSLYLDEMQGEDIKVFEDF